jgi:hypothetical protein
MSSDFRNVLKKTGLREERNTPAGGESDAVEGAKGTARKQVCQHNEL